MHTYLHFSIFWYWTVWCFSVFPSFSFSLSLSLVVLWHLSENLLRPGTLFVPRHLLLIPLHLMSSSTMIKPIRTFRRTFPNTAFIRNAKSSYWMFLILTFSLSSTIGVRSGVIVWHLDHLPFCDHTGVLLQHAQIWVFYTSVCHSCLGYAHCSHSGSYILCATRIKGSASWLPRLWSS